MAMPDRHMLSVSLKIRCSASEAPARCWSVVIIEHRSTASLLAVSTGAQKIAAE
jgi:hypothetical protein